MTQPPPYDRQFNFQNQQLLTPADPLPADEIDSEYNAIKLTLDQILANLELIQRDDGALANESVARVTLHSDVDLGFGAPSVWAHNTNYKADFDTIFHESFFYKANTTHLSDPSPLGFANDIAKWTLIADFSASAVQGLGTMSTQNANLVTITGGSVAGVTFSSAAATITGGAISGATITAADPDAASKVATKNYVDAQIAALSATLSGKLSAGGGTRMLFHQTAAPVGWTKITAYNDRALRVVNGTVTAGGTLAFSTVFGRTATDDHTLTLAEMPAHQHGGAVGAGGVDHSHPFSSGFASGSGQAGASGNLCASGNSATGGASAYSHTHAIGFEGSNLGHQHGVDLRVQYIDVIPAEKD